MIINENIIIKNKIGKGAYGDVFLGKDLLNNTLYAIKKISKKSLIKPDTKKYFNNEINIIKNLKNHPNIVKFINIKETITNFYIIFEYLNGGDLDNFLKKYINKYNKPIPEKIVKYIIKNVLKGLNSLNSQNIIHRDIKLSNILINYLNNSDLTNENILNAEIKIIDFGFAKYLKQDEFTNSIIGTPFYMDPKILHGYLLEKNEKKYLYNMKVDIWSIGIMTYYLLLGVFPFNAKNYENLIENIENKEYIFPLNKYEINLSKEAINFIENTLNLDEEQRYSSEELLKHNWLNNNFNYKLYKIKNEKELNDFIPLNFIDYWKPINLNINSNKEIKKKIKDHSIIRHIKIYKLLNKIFKNKKFEYVKSNFSFEQKKNI